MDGKQQNGVDPGALSQRVQAHNELAVKYRVQIDTLRNETAEAIDIWEVLLGQLFIQCLQEANSDGPLSDEVVRAALDFGFQCMGVGAVVTMDGLAQERIVI